MKLEFKNQHEVEKQKRQLKYDAIIQSLTILDAHFSQLMNPNKNQKIKLQFINTEDVRKCHNSLILSCENVELINLFSKILIGAIATPSPMELLNVYRNLVRTELGFGSTLDLDNDMVFFTFVPFDNDLNGEYKYDSSK